MEVLGFVFGIFGLLAYLQISTLKSRVDELERELTRMQGTSFHEDRTALVQAAKSYIGQKVNIDLKEDHMDADIVNYGNMKYGTVTVLDADGEWLLVRIENKKKNINKLIRMESVERISVLLD